METLGKSLVVLGLGIALIGALVWVGVFKWLRIGRLPGDIVIEREEMIVSIPLVSMLLVSGVLSLIVWLVGALRK